MLLINKHLLPMDYALLTMGSALSISLVTRVEQLSPGFVANSKYKIQALFRDIQGPKLHFSSTKIIDKKPYPRRGHS